MEHRFLVKRLATVFLLISVWICIPNNIRADQVNSVHQDAAKSYKAERLRIRSAERAGANIGYQPIYQERINSTVDYRALSDQIHRLGLLIRQIDRRLNNTETVLGENLTIITPFLGRVGLSTEEDTILGESFSIERVYGPNGVTEKSVRLLLEYRLLLTGNPRLKVGKIAVNENHFTIQVVTQEQSVVEEYQVDRKNGKWTPAH